MERETARTAEKETGAPGKIGAAEVRAAAEVLRRYRLGKQNLDRRIIDNEQFWKLRHWEQMDKAGEGGRREDIRPASGWLVNCILSKHADAMDCYPEPTVLPREPNDRREAEELSRILPVILKNNRFKKAYSQAWWNKLKSGCAVYGVFWDGDKLHGLGDVSIRSMDVLNLFWEPGVQDIQESESFFCTELVPNRRLEREYPQLEGKLGRSGVQVSRYLYDDKVDTSEQSLVVDWYYHTEQEGRQVLQYKGTQPPTTGRRGRRPLHALSLRGAKRRGNPFSFFRADSHASVRRGTWAPPYGARRSCGAGRVVRRDGISAGTRAVEHQGTHRGSGQRRATAHRGKLWRHNPLNREKPGNRLRVGQVSAKSQPTRVRKS